MAQLSERSLPKQEIVGSNPFQGELFIMMFGQILGPPNPNSLIRWRNYARSSRLVCHIILPVDHTAKIM